MERKMSGNDFKIFRTIVKIVFLTVLILLAGLALYYFIPGKSLPAGTNIDNIVVEKSKRQMQVYSKGKLVKTYKIALGRNPIGDKEYEGDKKTPEGSYVINAKNPNSSCHKNLGISYPDKGDIEVAKKIGKPTGGDIKIHGLMNGYGYIGKFHRWRDWTGGCIAVTDSEIDELYDAVSIGTPVVIKP